MDISKISSKIISVQNSNPILYNFLRFIYELSNKPKSFLYYLFRIFPIQKNKIILSNFAGGRYADNPKYIVEELLKHEKYDIYWLITKNNIVDSKIPKNVKSVRYGSFNMIYHLVTAKIWIDNSRKTSDTRKRKGQYYIQTWHGFGPKAMPLPEDSNVSKSMIKAYKFDSSITDIYVSNNNYLTYFYRKYFFFDGEVLQVGFPRNDILFNGNKPEIRKKVCNELNIPIDKKILIYAPTFREDAKLDAYTLDFELCVNSLKKRFGSDWVVLMRLHHCVANKILDLNKTNYIDATNYVDMQELIIASDFMITDYSSCMFDFALTKKPCILYQSDISEYDGARGFCIKLEELPFSRASTNEELQSYIETFNQELYETNLNDVFERYQMADCGKASEAVVNWINNTIGCEQ